MNSSTPSPEKAAALPLPVPLVGDGGVRIDRLSDRDPFEALDDLMLVVEGLCRSWPPRPGFGPMDNLRL
jgi:hypothetical protein